MPKTILPDVSHIAVTYARVSTAKQEEDGTSLDSQEAGTRKYCIEQGLTVLAAHRDTESGATLDRPGLQAALDQIRDHQAGVLVVYALDRLSRSQTQHGVIYEQVVVRAGAKIESVTERFDDTAVGQYLQATYHFISAIEREKILERTSRGKRKRDELGRPRVGSTPPYGLLWKYDELASGKLKLANGKPTKIAYILDPATDYIVVRIFTEVASGKSLRAVARGLIADGVKTPSQERETQMTGGKKNQGRKIAENWTRGTLQRFLHRECYRGLLIPEELWQRAQAQLIRSKEDAARNTVHPSDQLLRAGLARCGYCDRPMQVKWDNRLPVYHCGARYDTPFTPCSGGYPAVDVATLDADIWSKVVLILSTDALMIALTARALQGQDTSGQDKLKEQIESHTAIIGKLQRRRHSYYTSQADADGEAADFLKGQVKATSDLIANHERERDQLQAQLAAMEDAADVEKMLIRIPGTGYERELIINGPMPDDPEELRKMVIRRMHEDWAERVRTIPPDVEGRRAILRYIGGLVRVFRRNDVQPDGTHWEFLCAVESEMDQDLARLRAGRDAARQRADNTSLKL